LRQRPPIRVLRSTDIAQLEFGCNSIQAGGASSPYQFRIIVEKT